METPHIALVGLSGTGKSTIARLLAAELARSIYDIDTIVEHDTGIPIAAIFAEQGEAAFRVAEHAALQRASASPAGIIATGGGIVLAPANRALLATMFVVWLDAPPAVLVERLRRHNQTRPLLAGDDPAGRLATQRELRAPLYQAVAQLRLDVATLTPPEVVESIITRLAASALRTGDRVTR
jgi:shikimate kinase